jgi:hypothetical protein
MAASRWAIVIAAAVLVALFVVTSPVLCRKYTVPLVSNGKVVATARRPWAMPWRDNEFGVCVGTKQLFSLWGDFFDFPLYIYPFADHRRFLCIYDDDTAVLVFVVDFTPPEPSATNAADWPVDDYLRSHLAARATNVVIVTSGFARLPSRAELLEVSASLTRLSPGEFRARSFPAADLGLYRGYWPKAALLSALATNRTAIWP